MKPSKSIWIGLKRLLTTENNNWKVVALCVAGATTFWFFNALNKDYSTRINYPIEFVFNKEEVVVVEELPEEVRIVVSGGGWNLLRKTLWFNTAPIEILLENPSSQNFITKASLEAIIKDELSEVRLNYVETDTLFLHIEDKKYKKVALNIDSAGISLDKGYRIVSPVEVEPDSALFTGPSSFIDTLNEILLYVPYKQLNKSFESTIDLSPLESDKIQVKPNQIKVKFDVALFTRATREVPIQPVNFPNDSSIYLGDSTAIVNFMVRDDLQKEAENVNFRVIADYKNLNPQDSTLTLTVGELPAIIKNPTIENKTVPLQYGRPESEL